MKLKKTIASETPDIPLTVNNLLVVFKEFLSVWLNQILYYNKIYDPLIFDEYKAFNVIVWKNRHPHLEKYIDDLFLNVINNLIINKKQSNGLDKITCFVYNTKNDTVVRSYSLKFQQFILSLDETISELKLVDHDTSSILNIPGISWIEIYTYFQTNLFQHIQQLRKTTTVTETQEEDLFFKITVGIHEDIHAGSNWVRLKETKSRDKDQQQEPGPGPAQQEQQQQQQQDPSQPQQWQSERRRSTSSSISSRRSSTSRSRTDSMWRLTNDDDDMGNGYSRYHDNDGDLEGDGGDGGGTNKKLEYIHDIPPIFTDPKVMEQYYVAIEKQSRSSRNQQQAWLHPPQLPPHLESVILNNFNSNDNNSGALPIPNHVVLNHLATTSIKHNTLAVASIVRYKRKYVTQVLYAPL
ncbi:hypothetical protein KGF57_000663 [Candida theae]|uniref:Association with the SNF1 complex (ASC) domain-containing protein n=1 Tax=Candida theae TaxID=1198502 RepID=A0AAD5G0E8_9ASCO|nr:uncharacterized protein KGF57_000663 [Candida theae]KAI5966134.1 hypothetical protein KGF57_000663 [Candida theae]